MRPPGLMRLGQGETVVGLSRGAGAREGGEEEAVTGWGARGVGSREVLLLLRTELRGWVCDMEVLVTCKVVSMEWVRRW